MIVEFTGRQYEVTPAVRKQVEHGLEKLQKILGKTFDTHVILAAEKKRHIAEITITIRNNSLVGIAEAADMTQAQLAEWLGVTKMHVSHLEQGVRPPGPQTVRQRATAAT